MQYGTGRIGAIVAAAGRSTRMGSPKQLLSWGQSTVLATVLGQLATAGAQPVLCVVGHERDQIAQIAEQAGAEVVYNPDYAAAEMLVSYQAGVRRLLDQSPAADGALFALGDQPHIPVGVIRQVLHHALCRPESIVIPSYAMRRGHPIYLPKGVWPFLLSLHAEDSLRKLMREYAAQIEYVLVGTDAILRDMDTPQEYAGLKAEQHAGLNVKR